MKKTIFFLLLCVTVISNAQYKIITVKNNFILKDNISISDPKTNTDKIIIFDKNKAISYFSLFILGHENPKTNSITYSKMIYFLNKNNSYKNITAYSSDKNHNNIKKLFVGKTEKKDKKNIILEKTKETKNICGYVVEKYNTSYDSIDYCLWISNDINYNWTSTEFFSNIKGTIFQVERAGEVIYEIEKIENKESLNEENLIFKDKDIALIKKDWKNDKIKIIQL